MQILKLTVSQFPQFRDCARSSADKFQLYNFYKWIMLYIVAKDNDITQIEFTYLMQKMCICL